MFKKIISIILCPIMALPLITAASAAEKPDNGIVGEWIWGSTIADMGAEKVVERSHKAGITDLYLLVKGTGGTLGYLKTKYTDLLSRKNRDVLQETIDAAHERGIRVHAWICNVEDSSYKKAHPEAGMWHYIRARDNNYISLTDKGYLEYMTTVAAELAAYDIDGIHFDYIRYNHLANGWSEADFEALKNMGANIDRVKELIETTFGYHGRAANSSYVFNAYTNGDPDARIIAEYRTSNVKNYAKAIIEAARAVKPDLIFSAATMPEGAYNESYGDLHYGQNYSDAASLYDYICPMAYSSSYGQEERWILDIAKKSIEKGNRVVMGLQAFEAATTTKLMNEVMSIKDLMKDKTYGDGMLGFVLFRNGTYDYAKVTYDTEQKIITVKLLLTSKSYEQIRITAVTGIKLTDISLGDEFRLSTETLLNPYGTYAKISGTNILRNQTEGYIYLKYEGVIKDGNYPVFVRVVHSEEVCAYTGLFSVNDEGADIGTPGNFEDTTEEITGESPQTTQETPESSAPASSETENGAEAKPNGFSIRNTVIAAGAAALSTAVIAIVLTLISKKKKK